MKRLLGIATICAVLGALALAQSSLVSFKSAPDVTGTGATVQLFASGGQARAFVVIADSANTAAVRCGDSAVSLTQGSKIPAGAGLMWPPLSADSRQAVQGYMYDLSAYYCYIATGDKVSLSYAK